MTKFLREKVSHNTSASLCKCNYRNGILLPKVSHAKPAIAKATPSAPANRPPTSNVRDPAPSKSVALVITARPPDAVALAKPFPVAEAR